MTEQIYDYDPAVALENEEAMAVFLADVLETGAPAHVDRALGVIARAKGMTELTRQNGDR